ncbi:unnamed protein product (macronuclear) [Paramecium tetraurelia]|uniref:Uncharacterized protein n=1 Tax=Paramecium tetraurelia TaxID=5888 RepID=A0E791_PARTE|nr:uncharacterized protein GSPATT00023886001 [Paramecium tetraurelia]CAK91158.1 unnamed protein product [Paramecium tetraurelia]|eukprot:XP_001458555.1 hypothetical protein (macronuclear) [Paramecium tetraurelia strain d4-2]
MDYCDSCRTALEERTQLLNNIKNLRGKLEKAEMELKELKDENQYLKGKGHASQKLRKKNNMFKLELEQSYQKIEQLQLIIQHKDMIIDDSALIDNATENTPKIEKGK